MYPFVCVLLGFFSFSNVFFYFILRSIPNGNCLFSSVSILMVGDNHLVDILRLLTAIELFNNSDFYNRHPILEAIFEDSKTALGEKLFSSFRTVFELALGLRSDTGANNMGKIDSVKQEAITIRNDKVWSSFIRILGLSSVISRAINLYYSTSGHFRYVKMYNNRENNTQK